MKNMTIPQSIFFGLSLIAIAITSIPFSSNMIKDAHASNVQKIAICDKTGSRCSDISSFGGKYQLNVKARR